MNDAAIAIVGASCRFPGAPGLEAFWRLLIDGIDAVSEIGADRWSTRFFHHPTRGEPGKSYSWAAGLIDSVDQFEPGFFGISPREAVEMDPQQRLLLELAWHALEDAGIPATRLAGTAAGVYVGASSTDYGDLRLGDPASGGPHFVAGMSLGVLANRVSHIFDLRGPSLTIDTACSSSLVALHQACAALRAGEIDVALVGGVNLLLSPYPFVGFAQAGMLSRRGRCYSFDARADGYVRGEGGAVVVLKRLDQAIAEDDAIRGVVRGTGVSASGRTMGLSLPSETAQAELLRRVYAEAGVAPDALAFVEMHGTGTPAGDPAEAAAVGWALGQARSTPLPIGSVKTNIGHLEPASGIAGLLKAMLALERGLLPRSLHGETPNPEIPFDRLNLRFVRATEPVAIRDETCAGVSSFGFGGTNAHAVLGAPPARHQPEAASAASPPLLISARSKASLQALASEWRAMFADVPAERAPALLRAAARRRDHHPHRLVVLGDDLGATLGDFLAGKPNQAAITGTALREGKLAFVYSGNGAQFLGMGEAAYANAAFRAAVAEADRALLPHLGWSVGERLASGLSPEELRRADIAQPLLFAIQVAITTVVRDSGVSPIGFVGHSVGEIAAAWAASALSLDDAARVVAIRSRHQERTRGAGRMAVLALDEAATHALLDDIPGTLEIAAINSARAVTVAGGAEAIAEFIDAAARRGIAYRPLDLDFAFHSAAMEPIRDDLLDDLTGLSSTEPTGDFVSTVTGAQVARGALDAAHWWRNVREPVRFAAAIDTLIGDGYRVFAEIGPNPVLLPYLRDALRATQPEGHALATLERRAPAGDPFPAIFARFHVAGHDMSGAPWLNGPDDPRGLPLYPWQRERYWFGRTVEAVEQVNPPLDHELLGFRQSGPVPSWLNHLDTAVFPFLADHRIDGVPVLPAAAIIDMALAAARTQHPDAAALQLRDVELRRPMVFDGAATRGVRCTLLPNGDWQITSRRRLADEAMTTHATARVAAISVDRLLPPFDDAGDDRVVTGTTLYRRAAGHGLDYGESFRTVEHATLIGEDRAVVALKPPASSETEYLLAPSLLDGAFQGLLALLDDPETGNAGLVPHRFGQVRAIAPFGRAPRRAELRLKQRGKRSAAVDIALYDDAGALVAELVDCGFTRIETARHEAPACLRVDLVPAPLRPLPPPEILDRLPEIAARAAAGLSRDPICETELALLYDALLAASGRELRRDQSDTPVPEPLAGLMRRFDGEELPESGELWRSLLGDHPEMVAELTAAAMLQENAPGALRTASLLIAALHRTAPPAAAARTALAAILDEIAAGWPRNRPLRIREIGASRRCDRLHRTEASVRSVDEGEPYDIALCAEAGAFDLPRLSAGLTPGGALLAAMPSPSPLWQLIADHLPDWRAELAAAGFRDIGSVTVSLGPWPCEIVWARAPDESQSVTPQAPPSLHLIAGGADAAFAEALTAGGLALSAEPTAGDTVIMTIDDAGDAVSKTTRLLPDIARIVTHAADRRAPLWLLTRGAQQPEHDSGLVGAAVWGFARVLRNEIPNLMLRLIDFPLDMPGSECAQHLSRELTSADGETEIVWTSAGRHVPRLRRGLPPVWAGPDDLVVASNEQPGRLDRLAWVPTQPSRPSPGEIEITVRATGVNFRDVMAATGALPEEALSEGFAGAALGLECAGVVTAVGDGVDTIAVGDHVAGFAPAAIASRVITRADAVVLIPPDMSFAAAATLPVAFVTARYSLVTLARLQRGETVLIHAASGGVGLAAIQIAKALGATVIATAGSPAKRAFLRLVGADHVGDSRELRFTPAVRAATGDEGVDVVLNSLSGAAMEASLELLKPFGRFIELGKRDFYENTRMPARRLRRNVSYFAVDIDQLPLTRPGLAKTLLGDMAAALAAGEIRPLAHRSFAFAEIADAFRLMQSAQHIGKIVLVPAGNAGIALARWPDLALRRDGCYVVTGGLGGFGFATARWLAERGVGRLALIGRRGGETPGTAERVAELEALGAIVSIHAADVADPESLAAALDAIRRYNAPIRGVIHAAAEIVDGTAVSLSPDDIAAALRAKRGGAMLLDRLTSDDPLDLFWLFSSATTIVGAPGQGAYVAANAALEALARRRHAAGKPALAIAWGPIADVGALAERPQEREALARRLGARPISATTALAALPTLAASGLPVIALADIRMAETSRALPGLAAPFFDELRDDLAAAAEDEALIDRLASLDDAQRRDLITSIVTDEAARILRLAEGSVDPQRPLAELGMDSLMAIELRLAVEARLRLDLPLLSLSDGASPATLATRLAELLRRPLPSENITTLAARHEAAADPFALGGGDLAAEE